MAVTSYLRGKSIVTTQYIDDRLGAANAQSGFSDSDTYVAAQKVIYVLLELLTRLGYTLALSKCSLIPRKLVRFLGFIVDCVEQAYRLPSDKKQKFSDLREAILSCSEVDVKTLQRFAGKCVSMGLAVPGCRLFCREVNKCISQCMRNSKRMLVNEWLRQELLHWRFLDDWEGCSRWRLEGHSQVKMSTDASMYRYGAVVLVDGETEVMGDYWGTEDKRTIHLKEAEAVLKVLQALGNRLENRRVDLLVDNMAVLGVWENQGGRDRNLTQITKDIFLWVFRHNIDLRMQYVSSAENEADKPSRVCSFADSALTEVSWQNVDSIYGPHTVDLMALDSNAQKSRDGLPLRHFTPYPTPQSSGVNIFAQEVAKEENPYVFPPFGLILPVLSFLEEQNIRGCTIIVPEMYPCQVWWPKLCRYSVSSFHLGEKSEAGVIKIPTRKGFVVDDRGLKWALSAHRLEMLSKVDFVGIEERLVELERKMQGTNRQRRKESLVKSLMCFLAMLPGKPGILTCVPGDILKFLVWKDGGGKTVVHGLKCEFLGMKGKRNCSCPSRLASGTVEVIVHHLVDLFEMYGRGRVWDIGRTDGNPAVSLCVRNYVKQVKEEQARARVIPKQATPIFLDKLRMISQYIENQFSRPDLVRKERFVLLRDQAWLKLQFFAGDRAGDLALVVTQEVKILQDGTGLVFNHTFGKTMRGFRGKSNKFVVKVCPDDLMCPVKGLNAYVQGARKMGVDLINGYLFRVVSDGGLVLEQAVSYSVVYQRLRLYLTTLGLYEGETPHSFRAGCAVTLALSGAVDSVGQIMGHVGWFGEEAAKYYSRLPTLIESGHVATKLAESVHPSQEIKRQYREGAEFGALQSAFSEYEGMGS
ncbi:LOW QUALITY PROTEIN: uncharacterized protein [Argopecten irradians]|uniref:LOW QUALITY PROTEIN: uncharacterized protein n=1 Tax=Argopecten irradians TaxID=31199 RepID=UPI00371B4F08